MADKKANVTVYNIDAVEDGKAVVLVSWQGVYVNRLAENVYEILDDGKNVIEKLDKGANSLMRITYI